jgi:hypothetical protein
VSGWPTIYVLDGEGKIRYKNVRGDAMDKALETLFAEMKVDVKIAHEEEEGEGGGEQPKPPAGSVVPATRLLPGKSGN